jgi:SAM-dependent methyltransferase
VKAEANWWENFFTGLIVDFWRVALPPEVTKAESKWLSDALEARPGGRLLDVPCGDGRLALEMARQGCLVTGVDLSEEFLAAARTEAGAEGLSIVWRLSDMRDLPWREEFDGAFCGGSSFGYFGDEGDLAFLRAVARSLRPGARFALDSVKAVEVLLPAFRQRREMEIGDIRFEAFNHYDHETGWVENRYMISRGAKTETRLARHRIYTYREVVSMLERAGFGEIHGYGSLDGEPFRLGSARLQVVAKRE